MTYESQTGGQDHRPILPPAPFICLHVRLTDWASYTQWPCRLITSIT